MWISEHIHEVGKTRHDHLHQVHLVRALSYGAESNQCRVSFLPFLILNVAGHKLDDWLNDIVANHLGNFHQATASREVYSELIIFLIFILDIESLNAFQ